MQGERALAFLGAAFSECEEPAQARVAAAIDYVYEQIGYAVGESQPCADDEFGSMAALFAHLFGGIESSYNSSQRIDVGDGDGFIAQLGSAVD